MSLIKDSLKLIMNTNQNIEDNLVLIKLNQSSIDKI